MLIRGLTVNDIPQLQVLQEQYFKQSGEIPHGDEPIIGEQIIEEKGKIVAYGSLKLVSEVTLIMNPDLPLRIKVGALEFLMHQGIKVASQQKLKEVFAFCRPEFSAILQKHFGYKKIEGEPLVLEL